MDIEQIEIQLVLEAMQLRYGYDFSGYSRETIKRRIATTLSKTGPKGHPARCERISDMIPKILHDPEFFGSIVRDISITVTEMFRDASVYLKLREKVIPVLRTYPFINIWHAGCATGQEVYSMAILLQEEGLYDRAQIYATDMNDDALSKAKEGIYPINEIGLYTRNYQQAGGKNSFADYYHAKYDYAKMDQSLKRNITFANHNLVADGVFAETHLVLCRNVFIYFDKALQNRALRLFADSLCRGGFLCLGASESLAFSAVEQDFTEFAKNEKIYRKARQRRTGCPASGGLQSQIVN